MVDGPLEVEGKGLGAAMRLWEVLAMGGDTMLRLPFPVRDLNELRPPLEAGVRFFIGKQIDRRVHPARLHRLGAGGVELESPVPLAVFGALQVLLPPPTGQDGALVVDGKVIEVSERDGLRTAVVRFTGVNWDVQERIEVLARRGSGSAPAIRSSRDRGYFFLRKRILPGSHGALEIGEEHAHSP